VPCESSALHLQAVGALEARVAMDERLAIPCVGHHCKGVPAARVADQQAPAALEPTLSAQSASRAARPHKDANTPKRAEVDSGPRRRTVNREWS